MDLLILGKPNVGKTLFMINLAAYLGLREIQLDVEDAEGRNRSQRLGLERARRELVSMRAPKTLLVQSVGLEASLGRQRVRLVVVDTPGISEGIPAGTHVRHQVALTLERLMSAALVFHVVDASAVGMRRVEAPGAFDWALMELGRNMAAAYLVVANKMDKPGSQEGLRQLKDRARGIALIGVSAVTRRGFRDVKSWMMRTLA